MQFSMTAGDILTLQNGAGVPPPRGFCRSVTASYDRYADPRGEMRYALDAFEQNFTRNISSERLQNWFTRVGWRKQYFKMRFLGSGHTHFMTKLVLQGDSK